MSVGRNDPCPCGSGKKYKKCCFAKDEAKHSAELAARAAAPAPSAEAPKAAKRPGFEASGGKAGGAAPARQTRAAKATNLPRRGAV
jgi:hypothetical protein